VGVGVGEGRAAQHGTVEMDAGFVQSGSSNIPMRAPVTASKYVTCGAGNSGVGIIAGSDAIKSVASCDTPSGLSKKVRLTKETSLIVKIGV
jgi:hypothetical protein